MRIHQYGENENLREYFFDAEDFPAGHLLSADAQKHVKNKVVGTSTDPLLVSVFNMGAQTGNLACFETYKISTRAHNPVSTYVQAQFQRFGLEIRADTGKKFAAISNNTAKAMNVPATEYLVPSALQASKVALFQIPQKKLSSREVGASAGAVATITGRYTKKFGANPSFETLINIYNCISVESFKQANGDVNEIARALKLIEEISEETFNKFSKAVEANKGEVRLPLRNLSELIRMSNDSVDEAVEMLNNIPSGILFKMTEMGLPKIRYGAFR